MRALEASQRAIGVGALIAIAVYAAIASAQTRTTVVIAIVVVLALVHLSFALRLRAGGDLLRRDLFVAELGSRKREEPVLDTRFTGDGPYRSTPVPAAPLAHARRPSHATWLVLIGDAVMISTLTFVGLAALS